jgi:hypothetical protein
LLCSLFASRSLARIHRQYLCVRAPVSRSAAPKFARAMAVLKFCPDAVGTISSRAYITD